MEREELAGWLRLTLAPGLGNIGARKLLAAFGLPPAIFAQTEEALRAAGSPALARAVLALPPELDALVDATLSWLAQDAGDGRRVVTIADPEYPPALLQTEDPPPVIYLMGPHVDAWPAAISIVGSRNPTAQGLLNARQFGRSFVDAGYAVVSGLALGIDGAAHEGALEGTRSDAALVTIAVVGTGLDRVYPKQHLELAHRIVKRGLIVSEYPVGTPPISANFPKRNRIIAALGQGTVVVEAAMQSGSLITARQAIEQGRDVFAIPGSIHSPQSRGCHALLKQGAKLVETAQDVLEELQAPHAFTVTAAAASDDTEPVEVDALLDAIGFDPVSLDALVARTGEQTATLQARLLELELQGDVARLPGGLFQRIAAG